MGEEQGPKLYISLGNASTLYYDGLGLKGAALCKVTVYSGHSTRGLNPVQDHINSLPWESDLSSEEKEFSRVEGLGCRSCQYAGGIPESLQIPNFPITYSSLGGEKTTPNTRAPRKKHEKGEPQKKSTYGSEGFDEVFNEAIKASVDEATEMAKDCKCVCSEITVVFHIGANFEAKANLLNTAGFTESKKKHETTFEKVIECQKNPKPSTN